MVYYETNSSWNGVQDVLGWQKRRFYEKRFVTLGHQLANSKASYIYKALFAIFTATSWWHLSSLALQQLRNWSYRL